MRRSTFALLAVAALALTASALRAQIRPDDATRNAILDALDDERMAEAQYQAVLNTFGSDVQPFASIVVAERQHQVALIGLLNKYGVPVPGNPWDPSDLSVPGAVRDACLAGAATEKANITMYDEFLKFVALRDVRNVFTNLRAASQEKHLPAFEACAGVRPPGRRGPGRR